MLMTFPYIDVQKLTITLEIIMVAISDIFQRPKFVIYDQNLRSNKVGGSLTVQCRAYILNGDERNKSPDPDDKIYRQAFPDFFGTVIG